MIVFVREDARLSRFFERLLAKDYPIKLNIVSELRIGDYASQAGEEDRRRVWRLIKKYPDSVVHFERLPAADVAALLRRTHVGLLPSYFDTYGYSVIECQAAGCPVITTDIRALPEINNAEIGWIISVPKDEWGNGRIWTEDDRAQTSDLIEEGLFETIVEISRNPEHIAEKGRMALKRIRAQHDPRTRAAELEALYDECLGTN
jgi:glycosyltransferase involved in cell wall biosynthesis